MKTIKNIFKDTKKKAFTLIELLIVVAIIGILAGVGVPMYNGYMATAKVKSTQTNHANTTSFVAASLTKCATGVEKVTLGSTSRLCSATTDAWAKYFAAYFNGINKNPYSSGTAAVIYSTANPAKGSTSINGNGNLVRVKTNVGTEAGGDLYVPKTGWDEITKE